MKNNNPNENDMLSKLLLASQNAQQEQQQACAQLQQTCANLANSFEEDRRTLIEKINASLEKHHLEISVVLGSHGRRISELESEKEQLSVELQRSLESSRQLVHIVRTRLRE